MAVGGVNQRRFGGNRWRLAGEGGVTDGGWGVTDEGWTVPVAGLFPLQTALADPHVLLSRCPVSQEEVGEAVQEADILKIEAATMVHPQSRELLLVAGRLSRVGEFEMTFEEGLRWREWAWTRTEGAGGDAEWKCERRTVAHADAPAPAPPPAASMAKHEL